MRRRQTALLGTAVLVLAGCGAGPPADGGRDGVPVRGDPPSSSAAVAVPTAAETEPAELQLLPGPLPEDAAIDAAVGDAYESYQDHRRRYEAVARSGFADPALVEDFVASAEDALAESLRDGAVAAAADGYRLEQRSQTLDMVPTSVQIPLTEDREMLVTMEVCVLIETTAEELHGETLVDAPETDQLLMVVSMVQRAGRWLVWSHLETEEECTGSATSG